MRIIYSITHTCNNYLSAEVSNNFEILLLDVHFVFFSRILTETVVNITSSPVAPSPVTPSPAEVPATPTRFVTHIAGGNCC